MTAGAEDEEPAGTPRNVWSRVLRADCRSIPKVEARRLLTEYEPVVTTVWDRMRKGLRGAPGLTREDVLVVGRMAIFEAVQTYDASKGATLRTWVGIVIRWRMGELLHRMSRKGGYEFIDHDWAANAHAEHAVDDFEARMDALERLQRLAENFAVLPHRTKIILTQRLAGVESTEIAGSLGITACREQQILQECRATLRKALAESESVLTAEPTAAGTSEG